MDIAKLFGWIIEKRGNKVVDEFESMSIEELEAWLDERAALEPRVRQRSHGVQRPRANARAFYDEDVDLRGKSVRAAVRLVPDVSFGDMRIAGPKPVEMELHRNSAAWNKSSLTHLTVILIIK